MSLADTCAQVWSAIPGFELAEDRRRKEKPLVRIWDGDWNLHHVLRQEYSATFSWIVNDTGPGKTDMPFDSEVAQWIHDMSGRVERGEKRNVHITVDYMGARWGGRLDKAVVDVTPDGDEILSVTWLHDYENLKWYSVWPNPFLPAIFQFPRAWVIAAPVPWMLLMTLQMQLVRELNPLITIPDDPLDWDSYFNIIHSENWHTVVKPRSLFDDIAAGHVWGICSARFTNWHDMAKTLLADAELSVVCRRYLDGDPEPWEGANLRHGALVVDIVDQSGVYVGTAHGGNVFDGLLRTASEFAEDFIDSTANIVLDTDIPEDYFIPNNRLTDKALPYVVFRDVEGSPVQAGKFVNSPAKGVQVNCGGHSAPGINEAIGATIQAAGDILGGLVQIGSLGGTIDTLVRPLYEDVLAAFWSVKSTERAQKSGWSRYFEYWQDGANKAYTIASLMVLRAGFWATKTTFSVEVDAGDALPYIIGDNGQGHFFIGDRVGISLASDLRKEIYMDRCMKLDLAWTADEPHAKWTVSIGDDRNMQDPAQRAWGKIETMIAALKDLGVY